MAKKLVEIKRKIISLIRNRDPQKSLKLFLRVYNEDNPAEIEFVKNIYIELNRLDLAQEGFELLSKIAVWYPDSVEFQEIFENALSTYVGKLILQGNNLKFQRAQKEYTLEENLKKSDSLTRDKLKEENTKLLNALNEKAKESFQLALKYSPNNIAAYKGLADCLKIENKLDEVEKIEKKIEEITTAKKKRFSILEQEITEASPDKEKEQYDDYSVYLTLYNDEKYEELYQKIEENRKSEFFPNEALLLKARALVKQKRFIEANGVIFDAERIYTNYNELEKTKADINEVKHTLYKKAALVYLHKGINLGFPLGKESLLRAKYCLTKALELKPDDIDLLDKAYSAYKYLGEQEEAIKIKAKIYTLNDSYKITYDNQFNQTLCFIATYAFYDQPSIIDEFRWFRREYLLETKLGRRLNSLYVKISYPLTKSIQKNNFLRYCFKFILYFPLFVVRLLKCFSRNKL